MQLFAREALRLRVDSFELAAVDRDYAGVQEIQAAAKGNELLAYLADGETLLLSQRRDDTEAAGFLGVIGKTIVRALADDYVPGSRFASARQGLRQ